MVTALDVASTSFCPLSYTIHTVNSGLVSRMHCLPGDVSLGFDSWVLVEVFVTEPRPLQRDVRHG